MNSQELLEYVRRVKDLEIGVYEAQQIQDKFYQSVKANKPRKPAEPRYLSGMIPPNQMSKIWVEQRRVCFLWRLPF